MTDYADAATLLWGEPAPVWFVENLTHVGAFIRTARGNADKRLTHTRLRERIERLSAAARGVEEMLSDADVLSWMHKVAPGAMDAALPEAWGKFYEVARIAELAAASLPTGRGRARSTTDLQISAEAGCALIVMEAWLARRGRYPYSTDPAAHEAADALWHASGGAVPRRFGDSKNGWRRHFREAPKASEHYRAHMRWQLLDRRSVELDNSEMS